MSFLTGDVKGDAAATGLAMFRIQASGTTPEK